MVVGGKHKAERFEGSRPLDVVPSARKTELEPEQKLCLIPCSRECVQFTNGTRPTFVLRSPSHNCPAIRSVWVNQQAGKACKRATLSAGLIVNHNAFNTNNKLRTNLFWIGTNVKACRTETYCCCESSRHAQRGFFSQIVTDRELASLFALLLYIFSRNRLKSSRAADQCEKLNNNIRKSFYITATSLA